MPNSYEFSFQHNLDDVIDASDAVLAIGTEKVDTTTLKDKSLNNNDATIHGAMPSSGYFLGRTFDGDDDYLDCGNINVNSDFSITVIINPLSSEVFLGSRSGADKSFDIAFYAGNSIRTDLGDGTNWIYTGENSPFAYTLGKTYIVTVVVNTTSMNLHVDGVLEAVKEYSLSVPLLSDATRTVSIGRDGVSGGSYCIAIINNASIYESKLTLSEIESFFNTLARLPLYSHNFERYPNSDTSLTSVFPYTSGIITSGSFNKTDGLKCTSTGQIIFSNSFEFDGSEYITLTIDDIEYSGTTTVTQGTVTATIAQGSNDITIDMGTGDVLPDIRIQFREEV